MPHKGRGRYANKVGSEASEGDSAKSKEKLSVHLKTEITLTFESHTEPYAHVRAPPDFPKNVL